MALTLPLVRFYPSRIAAPASAVQTTAADDPNRSRAIWGIVGLLAFYIGLSGVWTFVSGIAEGAGISAETVGRLLSIATVLGIVGSVTASVIGGRIPRSVSLLTGYGVMVGSIALLLGAPQLWRFALAAFAFKFIWTFVLPFILATISDLDRDGRLMSTANLVVGGGLAIGPAISGQILEQGGGFDAMLLFSAALTVISFLAVSMSRMGRPVQTRNTEAAG